LDTESNTAWKGDVEVGHGIYSSLDSKTSVYTPKSVDHNIASVGYNTRAVAFFFGKDEYVDEILDWSHASLHLAQR
jgi:hypothetical protein